MKRLHTHSQNFLRSPRIAKTLLGHSTVKKTDTVLDIGAGSGVITSALAEKCAKVIAIEYEPRTAATLRKNVEKFNNVTVLNKNFLDLELPKEPYKIFANIPFHLSSPIIRKLTEADTPPDAIYLIVQKQFAKKLLIDRAGFTGLLGASIAPLFTAKIRYKLQRTDFWPHPAVDTVFIELLRRDSSLIGCQDLDAYRQFVEQCFSRQKYFETLGFTKRPSELTTDEWVNLFKHHRRDRKASS